MKSLFTILFCLWSTVAAANPGGFVGGGGAIQIANSWSCADADIICENFDGSTDCGNDGLGATNCNYSYTVTETTSQSVTFAATPTNPPGGLEGPYAVKLSDGSTEAQGPTADLTFGTAKAEMYMQLYFQVTTPTNLNDRGAIFFLTGSGTGTPLYSLIFKEVSEDNFKIVLSHRDEANVTRTSSSDIQTLTKDTWYGVRVYAKSNTSTAGISWAIDYDLDGTFTDQTVSTSTGTADRQMSVIRFSSTSDAGTSDVPVVEIDMIKINSTGYPGSSVP